MVRDTFAELDYRRAKYVPHCRNFTCASTLGIKGLGQSEDSDFTDSAGHASRTYFPKTRLPHSSWQANHC